MKNSPPIKFNISLPKCENWHSFFRPIEEVSDLTCTQWPPLMMFTTSRTTLSPLALFILRLPVFRSVSIYRENVAQLEAFQQQSHKS